LGVFLERVKKDYGIDMVRVPFRGGAEGVAALLSGTIPVGFYGIANVRSVLEAGNVVGLMVDGDKRSPLFPQIPTIAEATGKPFEPKIILRIACSQRHAQGHHQQALSGDRLRRDR